MSALSIVMRLLQAGFSCVVVGLLVWTGLTLAARRWPALLAQRSVWLAAQGLVVCVFVVVLVPRTAELSVLPEVQLSAPVAMIAEVPAVNVITSDGLPAAAEPGRQVQPEPHALDLLVLAPLGLLLVYAAGLALRARRVMGARRLWRGLLDSAEKLDAAALADHPGVSPAQLQRLQRHGIAVFETAAAISPMLLGLRAPRLLLPQHLRSFSVEQQQLIVEHELTHCERRDPWLLALALLMHAVFWFNPAMGWLVSRLSWAQELGCDQQVLNGRPQQQRLSYAAALVQQLKLQGAMLRTNAPAQAGLAFGGMDGASVRARIARMRQAGAARLGALGSAVLAGATLLVLAGAVVLQPAWAWSTPVLSLAALSEHADAGRAGTTGAVSVAGMAATKAEPWRYPLDHIRVSSFFRVVSGLLPDGHHGIDFAARAGTPIHAVAAGNVLTVGNDERYGNFIVIDHAQGKRSLYAHLQSVGVKEGEALRGGQVIGKVGATGMATGPHLHFEAYDGTRRIDPQTMLADLDSKASPRALQVRKSQFGY